MKLLLVVGVLSYLGGVVSVLGISKIKAIFAAKAKQEEDKLGEALQNEGKKL